MFQYYNIIGEGLDYIKEGRRGGTQLEHNWNITGTQHIFVPLFTIFWAYLNISSHTI